MTVPARSSGPSTYGSVSWTKRSETSVGATITASVSAAAVWPGSSIIDTFTCSPAGVTEVTSPTGTPRICTSEPG